MDEPDSMEADVDDGISGNSAGNNHKRNFIGQEGFEDILDSSSGDEFDVHPICKNPQ